MVNVIKNLWDIAFSSSKNSKLNRRTRQAKVLDETIFDIVTDTVKSSVSSGTGRSRTAIDRLKTIIVANNTQVNTKAASLQQAIKTDGSVEQNILNLVNRGAFFVLAPDGSKESSSNTKQKEFKKLLKQGLNLLGTRENSPLVKIRKTAVPSEYRDLILDEDGEFESDDNKFFQIVSDKPLSSPEAQKLALDFITNYVNSWEGSSAIFGGKLKPIQEYLDMDESSRKTALSLPVIAYVFIRHETGSYAEYHHFSVGVKINEEGIVREAEIKSGRKGLEKGARVDIVKADFSSLDKNVTRAILEADRAYKTEGVSVLEYGHLISAGYALLLETLTDLDFFIQGIDTSASSNLLVSKLHNLRTTLASIVQVARKLDSIVESWGTVAGPDVMGLTHSDILAVLASADSFDPGEIYVYEKVGGLVGRAETISRKATFTIELEDGSLQTVEGPLVGVMERAKFNNAKGKVTAALINILKKELEGDLMRALTVPDIIARLGANGVESTASDSILSASMKHIFGLKIDRGKGSQIKIKLKKPKVVKLGKSPATSLAKIKAGKLPNLDQNKTAGSSVIPTNNVKRSGALLDADNLAARVNSVLKQEVISQMSPPGLVNRTGRFAGSAEVISIDESIVTYRYMYSPYKIFSRGEGKAPWNTPQRDPDALLTRTINKILLSYTPGVSYSYRKG